MSKVTDNPAYWLGQAKDVRETAKQISDQIMKDILEEIARGYERIADRVRKTSGTLDDH